MNPTAPFNGFKTTKNNKQNFKIKSNNNKNIIEQKLRMDLNSIIYEFLNNLNSFENIQQYYNSLIIDFKNFYKTNINKLNSTNLYENEKKEISQNIIKSINIIKTINEYLITFTKDFPKIKYENMQENIKSNSINQELLEILSKRIQKIPHLKSFFTDIKKSNQVLQNFVNKTSILEQNEQIINKTIENLYNKKELKSSIEQTFENTIKEIKEKQKMETPTQSLSTSMTGLSLI